MKLAVLLPGVCIILLFSCSQVVSVQDGDARLIVKKYASQITLAENTDSAIFADTRQMLIRLKYVYKLTHCGDSVKSKLDKQENDAMPIAVNDTDETRFFKEVLEVSREHKVLGHGKFRMLDKDNPHILAYTSSDNNEQLLTILNLDEDNWSFKGEYPFSEMEMLLCNYEDGALPRINHSLIVRPFEARIYKVR